MTASTIDQLVHLAHLVLGFGAGAAAIVALIVFGSFALVPLIYFAFAPQARRAAAAVRA
jgi:hypothetical protein